ncbi:MAG: signal peptidase II [Syntrophobacteria bacterium]
MEKGGKGEFLSNSNKVFLVLATGVLLLDQLTKAAVSFILDMHEVRPLIHGLVNLTRVHNTGAAFGLLAGQASLLRTVVFLGVSFLAMGVVLWMVRQQRPDQKSEFVALSLVFGGAMGNVLDRARLGEVIDFIDIHYRTYHWPAFNVADAAISTGVVLLFWRLAFSRR